MFMFTTIDLSFNGYVIMKSLKRVSINILTSLQNDNYHTFCWKTRKRRYYWILFYLNIGLRMRALNSIVILTIKLSAKPLNDLNGLRTLVYCY